MTDTSFHSPAEVGRALGVGATTIKRWVDAGLLPAHKTVGGHRRIRLADVLRLVRQGNLPLPERSRLGLAGEGDVGDIEQLAQRLFEALREGNIAGARSVIHGAYAAGMAIEQIGDAVIAPAMSRLGEDWAAGALDVMHEHRGTQLCARVLHELAPALESNAGKNRLIAAGGSPEGDHSVLASLLVQMTLLDAGWEAVNLGPHTPLSSFRLAVRELKPRVIWLSASYVLDPVTFVVEYGAFYKEAAAAGVAVAIGGRALVDPLLSLVPHTFHGEGLTALAAFAATLHPRPSPPKRGRPAKQSP